MLILAAILFYSYGPIKQEMETHFDFTGQDDKGMSVNEFTKRITNNEKLVMVYFSASWCLPCAKLKPEVEALEIERATVCEILKLDTDENPQISEYLEVNSLPMFVLYKKGKKVWEMTGYQSKSQLSDKIDMYKTNL